jgi:hypothetical protein
LPEAAVTEAFYHEMFQNFVFSHLEEGEVEVSQQDISLSQQLCLGLSKREVPSLLDTGI